MRETVLILGAGVSVPYDFPSGELLVDNLIKVGFSAPSESTARKFADQLYRSKALSIDRFLSENPHFLDVGLSLIGQEMLKYELHMLQNQNSVKNDFFRIFIDEVRPSSFSQVTILTFNYDRVFEYLVYGALSVGSSLKKKIEVASALKIHHIHGRLPPLCVDDATLMGCPDQETVPFGLGQWRRENRDLYIEDRLPLYCKANFRTVFTNPDPVSHLAVDAIKRADRVFFLGFGYDDRNMERLGFNNPDIPYDLEGKLFAGTSFGLPTVKRRHVEKKFPFLKGNLRNVTVADFFREHFSLVDHELDEVSAKVPNRTCCERHAIQETKYEPPREVVSFSEEHTCYCGKTFEADYLRNFETSRSVFRGLRPKDQA